MSFRKEYVGSVYSGLAWLRTYGVVDAASGVDMYLYQTVGEREYVWLLGGVSEIRLSEWRGQFMVANEALKFPHPQCVQSFDICVRTRHIGGFLLVMSGVRGPLRGLLSLTSVLQYSISEVMLVLVGGFCWGLCGRGFRFRRGVSLSYDRFSHIWEVPWCWMGGRVGGLWR